MPDETYYSLLEVSETASAAEIKTAYVRLIREVHPDLVANAPEYWQRQAEEKSKEINEAYSVLSNREKRDLYDSQLASYRGSRAPANAAPASHYPNPPPPNPAQQRPPTASAPQSTSGASVRPLNQWQRLLFACLGTIFASLPVMTFWASPSLADGVFPFLMATALLFGVCFLCERQISRLFFALRLRPKHPLWAMLGIIVLVLIVGKIVVWDREIYSQIRDKPSANVVRVSQVKVFNGSLSDTTVSGDTGEKYPSAYNFTVDLQNNSAATVSLIRIKIRLFDCPAMGKPLSYTQFGATYESGTFDPSPPSDCKSIGEEEEEDFPDAGPGRTSRFANFYFPNHPQGGLRWNYEITKMDTSNAAASVPDPSALSARDGEQPPPGADAQQPLPDAAPVASSPGATETAAQKEVEARWRKSLSGSWVGRYNCAQGATGLTLTIAESADGGLAGIFAFYPVPGGNRFPKGSYSGAVTAGPDGSFEFKPQRWISQPVGFTAVALSGHYLENPRRVQGQVSGAPGCTSFDLSRQ